MVRWPDQSGMVARAVEMAGGLSGLKPGGTVLIKPNVNSDDPYPATTNPAVVRAVIEVVKGYNPGRILVADRSNATYNSLRAMQRTGIYEQASDAGAEVLGLENEEWVNVKPRGASYWQSLRVPRLLLDADYVINVPVAHTHFLAGYSMALKNWIGMIHPADRNLLHRAQPDYETSNSSSPPDDLVHYYGVRIAEANLPRHADFVVIDATKAFISGGPFSGEAVQPNIVIASPDMIAADAAGLALLTYLGAWDAVSKTSVWQQPQIAHAIELGLGVTGYRDIALSAEGVNDIDLIRDLMA